MAPTFRQIRDTDPMGVGVSFERGSPVGEAHTLQHMASPDSREGKGCFITSQRRPERLVIYCQITGASAAHATHCATHCTPCRPLIRAFSGWIRTPPPTKDDHFTPARKMRRDGRALKAPNHPEGRFYPMRQHAITAGNATRSPSQPSKCSEPRFAEGNACEDRVLDGPASSGKGLQG